MAASSKKKSRETRKGKTHLAVADTVAKPAEDVSAEEKRRELPEAFTKLELHAKQRAFVEDKSRYTLCEAGTKSGKTTGSAYWITKNAWENKDTIWWWVAPSYAQGMIAFDYIIHGDRMPSEANKRRNGPMPALLKPGEKRGECRVRRGGRFPQIELWNGSQIQFRTASEPNRLYGQGIAGAVVDEASRMSEAAFHAIRSTLTMSGGSMKIIGNPRGTRNWFYKLCQKAKRGVAGYSYHHLCSTDNPFVPPAEIEDARTMLPEHVFRELYLGEAHDGDGQVFSHIGRACQIEKVLKPEKDRKYVIGWDPARRVDNSAVAIFDAGAEPWREARLERLSAASWEAQLDAIGELSRKYNRANVIFDATSFGDVLEERGLARKIPLIRFVFTALRKNEIVNRMISALEREAILFQSAGREADLARGEMEMFEMKTLGRTGLYVYGAPAGAHDDFVMARCLALWSLEGGDAHQRGQIIQYFKQEAERAGIVKPAEETVADAVTSAREAAEPLPPAGQLSCSALEKGE